MSGRVWLVTLHDPVQQNVEGLRKYYPPGGSRVTMELRRRKLFFHTAHGDMLHQFQLSLFNTDGPESTPLTPLSPNASYSSFNWVHCPRDHPHKGLWLLGISDELRNLLVGSLNAISVGQVGDCIPIFYVGIQHSHPPPTTTARSLGVLGGTYGKSVRRAGRIAEQLRLTGVTEGQ